MRHLSLRFKITLWFTAALYLVVVFTYAILLSVSNQILQKTIRDNLIEAVENNFNDIKFYSSISDADLGKDASHFLAFESGFLEVGNSFLDEVNEVYTALYNSEAVLLYGSNPISRTTAGLKFIDSQIQTTKANGVTYYIFDRKLTTRGLEGLWLRGVVSETQGATQMTMIAHVSLIILPSLVLLASIGGYLLVKRMLRPIQHISKTAHEIGKDHDLKKRIRLGSGNDELHQLADTFNEMFDKLEKSFEAERRFISDASHELRTPMSVIIAQCEFSLEQQRTPGEYEDAFRVIQRQSKKMSKLINGMLDFTRLDAGANRYVMEKIDMSELVSSLSADMALIKENGITLQYDVEENIFFTGSRELLSRLLMNLISNAYRYGKPGGHIQVSLKKESGRLCLSVTDDGIGIAIDEQEKIFQRFYQADHSHSGAGIGLGLSMANEIARFHGGQICVQSEPGKGSTFTVVL